MSDADLKREGTGILGRYERGIAVSILTLALCFFLWRTWTRFVPAFYGLADEHGYMTTAKQLALHGTFAQHQTDPYAFVGETMMQSPTDASIYFLRQPIGYPLLCAAAYWMGGEQGPFAVNPILGILLLVGIYRVGVRLKSPVGGAVASLVIGANTLVLMYTLAPLSHMLDMTLGVMCIWVGLAWREEKRWWQAGLCGLLMGMAVSTRYVSVLLLLPLGLMIVERSKSMGWRKGILHVGIAGGVMVLALVPLLWYHAEAYGGIFRTGYSAGANATSFSVAWLIEHAPAMGRIVGGWEFGLSAMLLSAAVGIGVMAWRRGGFVAGMLLLWAIPPLVVYTAYYGMAKNNMLLYARFALPSFVPLVLLGAVWPQWMMRKGMGYVCVGAAAAAAIVLNCFVNPTMDAELMDNENWRLYSVAVEQTLREQVPAGSMVVCDNFTHYFTEYVGDYVVYDPAMFFQNTLDKRLADLGKTPHEFDPARTKQMAELLGGKSNEELWGILRERVRGYLRQGRGVYLISSDMHEATWEKVLGMKLKLVDRSMLGTLDVFEVEGDEAATTAGK